MTTNLIEREAEKTWTGGWTALGGVLMLVAGFATYSAISSPVLTAVLMGHDYEMADYISARLVTGFAVLTWFASFITSVLGMRRAGIGRSVFGWLVILALVLLGPILLFCAGLALTP
ncbi:hypothetical protein CH275_20590 [Rhodococcus sp. 06-235-1A]|uniref:hypothetical protein n=1 Tax=Rhodococcus sp. 06-235-1A TaxID=2022508 RepID=UPI000B9B50AF|nr:hypothetical protein [Rhodococcus sp. 06-235-1A]OZD01132.1 hypothetical protein CH275_20590 [Rhodococcus sp. 06-235-1A]